MSRQPGDGVVAPGGEPLRLTTDLTAEAWIYPTGSAEPGGIIVNVEGQYEIARVANGEIIYAMANSSPGWYWVSTGAFVPERAWAHVALTLTPFIARVYINGVLVHEAYAGGPIGDVHPAMNDLWIGARPSLRQPFDGLIDEVRVWSLCRTQPQIRDSLRTVDPTSPGLVAYYRFDDQSGSRAASAIPGGPDAILSADAQWLSVAPCCTADFNADNFVDFFDFDDFVACFEGGACRPDLSADFNADGFVDFFDFDDFVRAFESGC